MRRFYESEENEIDFRQAAAEALPACSPSAQDEIGDVAQNYFDENDYDSEEDLSNLIYNHIDIMADNGEFTEETKQDLIDAGYIESDEELEESVKKPLKESVLEKPFDEVEEGDIAIDWDGFKIRVLEKGTVEELCSYYPKYACNYPEDKKDYNAILARDLETGNKAVFYYGTDFGEAYVPAESKAMVRQISFDFIDTGKEADSDLLLMVQDAMTRLGIEIVGGPAFGDTSWSKEEYGLTESSRGNYRSRKIKNF